MIEFLRKRKLKKAFSKYVHVLGPALSQRYGAVDQYTVKQILATSKDIDIDTRFIAYAVALYRRDESENTVKLLNVDQYFLDTLRMEIASSLFGGNINYKTKDVLNLSKRASWRGGPPPNWMANDQGRTSL